MNALLYATLLSAFMVNWSPAGVHVPAEVKVVPDLLAGFLGLAVVGRFASQPRGAVQGRYVIFAIFLVTLLVTSVLANLVDPGAVFQAIRTYVMHIPLFLLPAVYNVSPRQIRGHLVFMLALCLVQLPAALYQRFVLDPTTGTGDLVTGTLGNSKTLSIVMLSAIALLWAFHLRGRIRLLVMGLLMLALFTPTVINETTGTLFLLPVVLAVPLLMLADSRRKLRYSVTAAAGGCLLIMLFAGVYNAYYGSRWGGDVFNVFAEGRFIEYELRGEDDSGGVASEIGRIEAILIPIRTLSEDPVKLLVGAGAGNVQTAPLPVLEGAYADEYEPLGANGTTAALLLWETGLLGLGLFFAFLFMVWRDAWLLRSWKGIEGAVALGWLGVLAMLFVATVYVNVFADASIMYAFAYVSGYLAARRGWLAHEQSMHIHELVAGATRRSPLPTVMGRERTRPS